MVRDIQAQVEHAKIYAEEYVVKHVLVSAPQRTRRPRQTPTACTATSETRFRASIMLTRMRDAHGPCGGVTQHARAIVSKEQHEMRVSPRTNRTKDSRQWWGVAREVTRLSRRQWVQRRLEKDTSTPYASAAVPLGDPISTTAYFLATRGGSAGCEPKGAGGRGQGAGGRGPGAGAGGREG